MTDKALKFSVGHLMEAPEGTRENYTLDTPVRLDGIKPTSNLRGGVELMRFNEGVNAAISRAEIAVELICERCLEPFILEIKVEHAERQYLEDVPEKPDDPNDLFLIDIKNHTIDLTELLRQEIILHFPLIPVCSNSCKGICPHCGTDKNKNDCDCQDENPQKDKPLSQLKDLIKQNGQTSSSKAKKA